MADVYFRQEIRERNVAEVQKEIMEKEIAEIIKGFRQDSIEIEINQGYVHKWISQFSPATQDIILEETLHILKEWYFGRSTGYGNACLEP